LLRYLAAEPRILGPTRDRSFLIKGQEPAGIIGFATAVFLILAWRNAGYLGLDGFALPMARERLHRSRPATGITAPPLPAEEPVS
jgi:hypothetical protein